MATDEFIDRVIDRLRPPPYVDLALVHSVFSGESGPKIRDDAEMLWIQLEDPSRFELCWIASLAPRMAPDVFSVILGSTWSRGKYGGLLSGRTIGYHFIETMFGRAIPEYLMEPDDLSAFLALPETIIAYRGVAGVSKNKARYGMSWTLDPGCAAWFANRAAMIEKAPPLCLKAEVQKSVALAYFNGRDESEIVVISGRARHVQEFPVRHASVSFEQRLELVPTAAA